MKTIKVLFYLLLIAFPGISISQNAPVTTVPDTIKCPGSSITIPIRVSNFKHIGSLSLKLQYNTNSLTYVSWSNTSGFPGLSLNASVPGTLVMGAFTFTSGGITLADNSIFFKITFNYINGSAPLAWLDDGNSCEYTGPAPTFTILNDIPAVQYYINGSISPSLVADFSATSQLPAVFDTVQFFDNSAGAPTNWNWSFAPASYQFVNGTTQGSQNPMVTFTNNGPYAASLTVNNTGCSAVLSRNDWIHAGTPGFWTGDFSSAWNTPSNWHNGMVPDALTDVVIPPAASNWPVYEGDFSIGLQCFNLTIQGLTGQLTVTGDFIFP